MSKLDKIVTLIPLEEIEWGAKTQIFDNAEYDCVKKIAIMPDCHQGYALPIGAVALVEGNISPAYVGFDIGCGMTFLNTEIPFDQIIASQEDKVKIYNDIRKVIPTGFDENPQCHVFDFKSASGDSDLDNKVNDKLGKQYSTLGSGNHFIELGKSLEGELCITIHSGSRRPGWEIGKYYMSKKQLFFSLDSDDGKAYLQDMNFALDFALKNRAAMLNRICDIFGICEGAAFVNENHNHAVVTHKGVIHRKGATPADFGQIGIIPGSMLTGIYITKGKGNDTYLSSASHGAGRKMSRGEAKKNISLDTFKEQMKDVVANVCESTLDEAPDAYKDLEYVIKAQDGIVVDVVDFIQPMINVKG